MKFNQDKADSGHYIGLTDWLFYTFGDKGVRYKFMPVRPGSQYIGSIWFADQKDEMLAILRWGA